jgi:hypothetical protein
MSTVFHTLEQKDILTLICSIIAILISIGVGIFNYWNTQRSFRAAYYPHLQFRLIEQACESGVCPHLHVYNTSRDKSVLDAQIKLLVKEPFRLAFLRSSGWRELASNAGIEIKPGEEFILKNPGGKKYKSLEEFMVASFPKYIQPERIGKSRSTYYLSHNRPLRFLAVVVYETNSEGTSRITTRHRFQVRVETNHSWGQPYRLTFWKF